MAKSPTPVWLDCDTGHDDAFAILLAARHPQVNILGVSTVYGNAPLTNTTYNSRAILKAIGRDDVRVYAGAAHPFCREAVYAPDIHGESGLDGTTCLPSPTVPVRTDKTAVEAMYQALIRTPKDTAWLVPTGALTNAALLFATHPDLIEHIAGLSIMGGAIGGSFTKAPLGMVDGSERIGNHTPWAEFNIYLDPESAKSLFSNPVLAAKTTLITLDLTHQFLATKEVRDVMLQGIKSSSSDKVPSQVRKLFTEILEFFAKTYADMFSITAGPPVHDVLAVAAAFAPELLNHNHDERFELGVITEGAHGASSAILTGPSQCGRTIAKVVPSGSGGVWIPRSVDDEKVWHLVEICLAIAEDASAS